jgi:hypothetical protein
LETTATIKAFGAEPTRASLVLTARSTGWRVSRSVGFGLAGYSILILSILPPHALWALVGGVGGTWMAVNKWLERFTLERMSGTCPHCGAELTREKSGRLRPRVTITCDTCQRSSEMVVDLDALDSDA